MHDDRLPPDYNWRMEAAWAASITTAVLVSIALAIWLVP